jgi:hypothetical protein
MPNANWDIILFFLLADSHGDTIGSHWHHLPNFALSWLEFVNLAGKIRRTQRTTACFVAIVLLVLYAHLRIPWLARILARSRIATMPNPNCCIVLLYARFDLVFNRATLVVIHVIEVVVVVMKGNHTLPLGALMASLESLRKSIYGALRISRVNRSADGATLVAFKPVLIVFLLQAH